VSVIVNVVHNPSTSFLFSCMYLLIFSSLLHFVSFWPELWSYRIHAVYMDLTYWFNLSTIFLYQYQIEEMENVNDVLVKKLYIGTPIVFYSFFFFSFFDFNWFYSKFKNVTRSVISEHCLAAILVKCFVNDCVMLCDTPFKISEHW
jgi:hypothetical protein